MYVSFCVYIYIYIYACSQECEFQPHLSPSQRSNRSKIRVLMIEMVRNIGGVEILKVFFPTGV